MIWESQNWLKMALQLLIGHLILHSTLPNDTKKLKKKKMNQSLISESSKFQVSIPLKWLKHQTHYCFSFSNGIFTRSQFWYLTMQSATTSN